MVLGCPISGSQLSSRSRLLAPLKSVEGRGSQVQPGLLVPSQIARKCCCFFPPFAVHFPPPYFAVQIPSNKSRPTWIVPSTSPDRRDENLGQTTFAQVWARVVTEYQQKRIGAFPDSVYYHSFFLLCYHLHRFTKHSPKLELSFWVKAKVDLTSNQLLRPPSPPSFLSPLTTGTNF